MVNIEARYLEKNTFGASTTIHLAGQWLFKKIQVLPDKNQVDIPQSCKLYTFHLGGLSACTFSQLILDDLPMIPHIPLLEIAMTQTR